MLIENAMDITPVDEAIERAHAHLKSFDEDAPEYQKTLDQLIKLYDIRTSLTKEVNTPEEDDKNKVHLKDWIPVIGSIGGILAIVIYESAGHAMTSKALGFVSKLKS